MQIVGAYTEDSILEKLPEEFYHKMQTYVLKCSHMINYKQAIDLASCMSSFASTETMEVFDRIIG